MDNYQFNESKYTKWYRDIILRASARTVDKNIYHERHHIIPRSLGGSNRKTNIVALTAREHFIVHLLLIKMVSDKDVYKMVHAIIRFTMKVSSAQQYELLRTFVHKYSSGRFNCSYGKIWIHSTETQEILYVMVDKFECMDKNIYTKGLPYQRGGVAKGSRWINNGIVETLCNSSDLSHYISNSWLRGRLTGPSNDHMKHMSSIRHQPSKDKEHSNKLTGRVQVFNPTTMISKRIHKDKISDYLDNGFEIRSVPTSISKRCTINGKEFNTISEASQTLSIRSEIIRYRLSSTTEQWKEWKLS